MAKTIRKAASAATHRTVKTSVTLDVNLHSRISALASLRGTTIGALMAEAAEEAVRGIVVIDRRRSADQAAHSGPVKESAPDAA
jgi:predicted DNA-binding ribbon-helix-helix protein